MMPLRELQPGEFPEAAVSIASVWRGPGEGPGEGPEENVRT
jgi:hypothetical protein